MSLAPHTELDQRYSDPEAEAVSWPAARGLLAAAETYWLVTLRPGAGAHSTPLLGVVDDDVFHFCTGVGEQKERNLRADAHCTVITGTNALDSGTDIVVEGRAHRVEGDATLTRLAATWEDKYGEEWRFETRDGVFYHTDMPTHPVPVFAVRPTRAYAFGRSPSSHTRYRFDD